MDLRTCMLAVAILTAVVPTGRADADSLPAMQAAATAKHHAWKNKPHRSHPPTTGQYARNPKASDFADVMKTLVRERGAELCTRYGGDPDCIEEIEVCFS